VQHTCITDDGGTPNRRCDACEAERQAHEAYAQVAVGGNLAIVRALFKTGGEMAVAKHIALLRIERDEAKRDVLVGIRAECYGEYRWYTVGMDDYLQEKLKAMGSQGEE
jgi:hypothetical protein